MAGIDDPMNALLRSQGPIFGMPTPNYNPFGFAGGNGPLGLMLSLYGPQLFSSILGRDSFLPSQFPAQSVMDQMVSAKYMQNMQLNIGAMSNLDQTSMRQTFAGIRSKFTDKPLDTIGRAQLNQMADMANSPIIQGLMGTLMGPQNVEDLFYGRRGSAVSLANSVNQLGFYRRDAVTGGDQMSGEGLKAFTEQIYSNLYGPGADLNDVSGLSAGRVGVLATELGRRGLLPASVSAMAPGEQMATLRDKTLRPADFEGSIARELADKEFRENSTTFGGKSYAEYSEKERQEILNRETADPSSSYRQKAAQLTNKLDDPTASFKDIIESEGGASAVRKIDATKVSNALKDYTGAISAVREIFGANGQGNAPMQQLMAAMEALTQNGTASMKSGQLENIMRRIQLASRDSGVNLEALMGLTARAGALADANGLDRSLVPENVVAAMQAGQAMRDTGAFTPGFGKMDADTAGLFALDRSVSASTSSAAKYMGAAKRLVAENEGNADFASRSGGLIAFVNAVENGAGTYFDPTQGRSVNIYQEMGENPGMFFSKLFGGAKVSEAQLQSYFFDPGTQEYARGMASKAMYAQSHEIKTVLANRFADAASVGVGGVQMDAGLSQAVGRQFSRAMLDEVDTAQDPAERLKILGDATRRGFLENARAELKAKGIPFNEQDVQTLADQKFTDTFGAGADGERKFREFVGTQQSYVERAYSTEFGGRIAQQRQIGSARSIAEQQRIDYRNMVRATVATRMGSDGSNFLQRMNDVFNADGSATSLSQLAEIALGGISMGDYRQQLMNEAAFAMDMPADASPEERAKRGRGVYDAVISGLVGEYNEATLDTAAERDLEIARLNNAAAPGGVGEGDALESFKQRFTQAERDTLFRNKKGYRSNATIAADLSRAGGDKSKHDEMLRLYHMHFEKDVASDKRTAKLGAAEYARLAEISPFIQDSLSGIVDLSTTLTETQAREIMTRQKVFAGDTESARQENEKRVNRINDYTKALNTNQMSGEKILDVFDFEGNLGAQRGHVAAAIDTLLANPNDNAEVNFKAVEDQLAVLPKGQREQILNSVRFARAQKALGKSFEELGAPVSEEEMHVVGRISAVQKMLDETKTPEERRAKAEALFGKDAEKMLKQFDAYTGEGKEAEEAAIALRRNFSDKRAAPGEKSEYEKTVAVDSQRDEIEKSAGEISQKPAGPGTDMFAGIGKTIADTFVPPVVAAMEKAFKDVKLENVTIGNINMDWGKIMPSLMSGIMAAVNAPKETQTAAAAGESGGGPVEVIGKLEVTGMDTAIVKLMPKLPTDMDGGNAPVVSQA